MTTDLFPCLVVFVFAYFSLTGNLQPEEEVSEKKKSKNENSSEIKTQEKWEMYDFQPIPKYKKTEQIRNTNQSEVKWNSVWQVD